MSDAPRARNSDVDPVRELRTGQRRVNSRINRPDTRKNLNLSALPSKNRLLLKGVHTRTLLNSHKPDAPRATRGC